MIDFIKWENECIGIFMRHGYSPEQTRFLTSSSEPLQCGIGVFKKGRSVEPHRHVGSPAQVTEFQEFILIRKGKALAEVYDPNGVLMQTIEMLPGDALLLLRGGHAFHFLEDTELLEVKQGPYLGREKMKSLLSETSPAAPNLEPPVVNA